MSIEYALIRDINDQAWRADLLGKLLNVRGRGWVHVNPIPLNPTPGSKWTASDPAVERAFVAALEARGHPDHHPRHPRSGDRRGLRPAGRDRHRPELSRPELSRPERSRPESSRPERSRPACGPVVAGAAPLVATTRSAPTTG